MSAAAPRLDGDAEHSARSLRPVGAVAGVECSVAATVRPWELDIDAIVVSVGESLGGLGVAVAGQFPDAGWESVDFSAITPDRPALLDLRRDGRHGGRLRMAVLASPHEGGMEGPPSLDAVGAAVAAAIRLAAGAGATAAGLPLLAAGILEVPAGKVAAVTVPAAVRALREVAGSRLRRLVLFDRYASTVDAIVGAWESSSSAVDPGTAGTTASGTAGTAGAGAKAPTGRAEATGPRVEEAEEVAARTGSVAGTASVFSAVDLAGGVSSDLVDPNAGIPLGRDQLGVAPYVSMLATVIADRHTPLPLSVGIFGEWGSGKSTFMGLLRGQVDALAGSDRRRYCDEVVQIGFNAWHYADSNLWASLADEIFRQLGGSQPGAGERAEQIRAELSARLDQRSQLEATTRQAGAAAAELRARVDAAGARQETQARTLLRALESSPRVRRRLDRLWAQLGVTSALDQGKLLAAQMRGTLTDVEALRRAPWDRRGRVALAAAAVVLLGGLLGVALAPAARGWLATVAGAFSVLAGAGITALARARAGLRTLRELSDELHTGMDAAERQPGTELAGALTALREAEAEQRVAEAQLSEVVSRVGELGRQLAELTPGRRLYAFLADRAQADSYSRNLGLVSTIRKDFQQLVMLMAEWRANPDAGEAPRKPVDRIVLYIDDLDRCGPRQVVEVLQAVHLLLAFELFVVVVGVDPRWLLRSLTSHYGEILELDGAPGGAGDRWQVTPEDYLEKILNIPLVLPGMAQGSLLRLVRSIVEDEAAPSAGPPAPPPPVRAAADGAAPDGDATGSGPSRWAVAGHGARAIPVEPGSEVYAQQRAERRRELPRPLTDGEISLLAALDPLVATPREAKRLVNLYRMLRATRDLSPASRFLGEDGRPGECQAVVVLLGLLTAHARLLGMALDAAPDPQRGVRGGLLHRPPDTRWADFVGDFQPRPVQQAVANPIVGPLPEREAQHWARLHRGLVHASTAVTLPDVSYLQLWAPRIRRFSYALTPQLQHR